MFEDGMTAELLAQEFVSNLQRQRRMCLWGQHGTGKTTLLRALQTAMEGQGVRTIFLSGANHDPTVQESMPTTSKSSYSWFESQAQRKLQSIDRNLYDVVLLDSGECLRGLAWWQFLYRLGTKPLIITSHRPKLPVLYHCRTSKKTFIGICQGLLNFYVPAIREQWTIDDLSQLYDHNAGDVRKCFFELYDRCAQLQ